MKKYMMKYLSDKNELFLKGYRTLETDARYLDINDRIRVAIFKQKKAPYNVKIRAYDTTINDNRCVVYEGVFPYVLDDSFIVAKAKLGILSAKKEDDSYHHHISEGYNTKLYPGATFTVIDFSGKEIKSNEYAIEGITSEKELFDSSCYSIVGVTSNKEYMFFDRKLDLCEEHVTSFSMVHINNQFGNSEKRLMVFSYKDNSMKISCDNKASQKCKFVQSVGRGKEMPLVAIVDDVDEDIHYEKFIPAKYNYETFDDCPIFKKINGDVNGQCFMVQDMVTGNWGFVNYLGKVTVPLEYKDLTPMHLNRAFGYRNGRLVMVDNKGREYPDEYKRLIKNFDAIIYGTGAKTFALVEDKEGPFYIDQEGHRYKIYDPKVLESAKE
ncbi:MAG: hypothetical protein MJ245_03585 [Clostridia bacterium]|nr:hypothetical protein [Clostridia bacterium]